MANLKSLRDPSLTKETLLVTDHKVLISMEIVLFSINSEKLHVLLSKRVTPPFLDFWTIPNGILRMDIGERGEDPDRTVPSKLKETTGLADDIKYFEQLKTYAAPDRDPREQRVISIAYLGIGAGLVDSYERKSSGQYMFIPVDEIINSSEKTMAFDHYNIFLDSIKRLKAKIGYSPIATHFCSEEFTIRELRRVYEIIWDTTLDPGNFQKKVLSSPDFLVRKDKNAESSTTGGRPAKLYSASTEALLGNPIRQ